MTFVLTVMGIMLALWIVINLVANRDKEKANNIIEKNARKSDKIVSSIDGFKATSATRYVVGDKIGGFLYVDKNSLQLCIVPFGGNTYKMFNPSDLIDVKVVEDNSTITETKVGGQIGKAVVGGVLFGGVGAVVGGLSSNKNNSVIVNSLRVVIHLNDFDCHTVTLNCLANINVRRDSQEYRAAVDIADNWYGLLNVFANHAA